MKLDLTLTFLELGDATSRNLEFSHCDDVWVSYGEETITESNLLEIRRRHPEHVRVRTFPKQVEATNGADWEWHIVGLKRTLSMRVQAKRLQRNGVLKVKHTVKSTGEEQRDLLIGDAEDADTGRKSIPPPPFASSSSVRYSLVYSATSVIRESTWRTMTCSGLSSCAISRTSLHKFATISRLLKMLPEVSGRTTIVPIASECVAGR